MSIGSQVFRGTPDRVGAAYHAARASLEFNGPLGETPLFTLRAVVPHPPAPSPHKEGGGAKRSGTQGILRGRRHCRAGVYRAWCRAGGRAKARPYNSLVGREAAAATRLLGMAQPRNALIILALPQSVFSFLEDVKCHWTKKSRRWASISRNSVHQPRWRRRRASATPFTVQATSPPVTAASSGAIWMWKRVKKQRASAPSICSKPPTPSPARSTSCACAGCSAAVNSMPEFTDQHLVINGASELFWELYDGELHARSALGFASLPNGFAVEIEAIFEIVD